MREEIAKKRTKEEENSLEKERKENTRVKNKREKEDDKWLR